MPMMYKFFGLVAPYHDYKADRGHGQTEPLLALLSHIRPWIQIGSDLFELNQKVYLIMVDYASRLFEIQELKTTTTAEVICHICKMFVE